MAKAEKLSIQHYAMGLLDRIIEDDEISKSTSEYLSKHSNVSDAAKHYIADVSNQASCIAIIEQALPFINLPEFAGATSGFLGLLYFQLHLVCGVAAIAGKDIHSNEVKTQCVECITVNVMARALRVVVSKAAGAMLEKYNLKKAEKAVDAVAELFLDWGAIKIVSKRAYKTFLEKSN